MNDSLRPKTHSSILRWLPLLVVMLLTACKREEIKVYYAPKDASATPQLAPMAPSGGMGTLPSGSQGMGAAKPQLAWTTPAGWTEMAPGAMRVASFAVQGADGKTADMSVVPLAGDAGGDAPNVNRWRGQVGLADASEEELHANAQAIEAGGQPAALYEQVGTKPGSGEPMGLMAAIQHRDGVSWFFKMTGDPDLIKQQKPVFVEFLKSLKFESAATAALPAGHPDISMTPAATTGPISHEGQPAWQVPAGWQEVSGGEFLVAKFMITDESGTQAAVNVSASTGNGGGLAANVTRWRGQLGLAPISDDEIAKSATTIDVAGGKGTLVEMNGTDARTGHPAALTGVMVTQAGRTWSYKLMGPSAIVIAEKNTFLKFVQTVKY